MGSCRYIIVSEEWKEDFDETKLCCWVAVTDHSLYEDNSPSSSSAGSFSPAVSHPLSQTQMYNFTSQHCQGIIYISLCVEVRESGGIRTVMFLRKQKGLICWSELWAEDHRFTGLRSPFLLFWRPVWSVTNQWLCVGVGSREFHQSSFNFVCTVLWPKTFFTLQVLKQFWVFSVSYIVITPQKSNEARFIGNSRWKRETVSV